jgi:tetratricopeptide (TPR) repeat protein
MLPFCCAEVTMTYDRPNRMWLYTLSWFVVLFTGTALAHSTLGFDPFHIHLPPSTHYQKKVVSVWDVMIDSGWSAYHRDDLNQAEFMLQEALKAAEKFEEQDPRLPFTLYRFGRVKEAREKYTEAIDAYERAIMLWVNHKDIPAEALADPVSGMGRVLMKQEQYSEALPFFQKALDILKRGPETDLGELAGAQGNLAVTYIYLGDLDKAEPLARQALETEEKSSGSESFEYAFRLHDLAVLYDQMENKTDLVNFIENYANLLKDQGRESEAAKLEAQAKSIHEKLKAEQPE